MSYQPLIWSDEYEGPRFTYGLTYRRADTGAVPAGYILGAADPADPRFAFGTIQYPRQLTSEEIAGFQLTPADRRLSEEIEADLEAGRALLAREHPTLENLAERHKRGRIPSILDEDDEPEGHSPISSPD